MQIINKYFLFSHIKKYFDSTTININNNNNRINSLRQICTIIRAISLPNKEHMEN